jgi:aspartate aminotransferase-like enzyme
VRAIYLTSADTSTGVEHAVEVLGPLIRARTDALLVVDAVCDFGGARDFHPSEWDFDVVISCSQKCLALPPGLVVAHVAPRAWAFCETADLPRFYFDWRSERAKQDKEHITAWTSPVSLFRGLQETLLMLEEEGMDKVVARYAGNARAFRAAMAALGLQLFPERSTNALSVVRCPAAIDATRVVTLLQERYQVRIANGQDRLKGQVFRVGHMGFLGETDVLGLVHVVERALADLGHRGPAGAALTAAQQCFLASG